MLYHALKYNRRSYIEMYYLHDEETHLAGVTD